ncbi:hypothetical protein [Planococcus plakortidis]|uniref:hypothetical protein n=1 Tax=Planococcus plakortidis TaxID=1038856 RepID=UPI00385CBBB5
MSDLQIREFRKEIYKKEWELESSLLKIELIRIQNEQALNEIKKDLRRGNE